MSIILCIYIVRLYITQRNPQRSLEKFMYSPFILILIIYSAFILLYRTENRIVREATKKVLSLVAGPLRGGKGLNWCATKEKITFFNVRKKVPMVPKLKALCGRATKKRTFLRLP